MFYNPFLKEKQDWQNTGRGSLKIVESSLKAPARQGKPPKEGARAGQVKLTR
jgi:hypothetical protein